MKGKARSIRPKGSKRPLYTSRFSRGDVQGDLLHKTLVLLRRYNVRAKKELGQNFLIDGDILDRIIAAAELRPEDIVMEVGPGLGIVTEELGKRCQKVVAVEVDPNLVTILNSELSYLPNVTVVEQDILEVEPQSLLAEVLGKEPAAVVSGTYKVVTNLPYYITSPILRHFLEAIAKPKLLVLMVQKEVAQRITAKPGDLSLLGVSVQVYGRPQMVAKVPASSFLPKPNVDSAIVRIDVYDRPAVEVDDMEAFFQVVQAGFSQPRKQLHNALSQRIWLPPGKAQDLLSEIGIDPRRRAETLSLDDWARLYLALTRFKKTKGTEGS